MAALVIKFLSALVVGFAFRILWSRFFMDKNLYYVPPQLVALVVLFSIIVDPKSGAFIVGIFATDLIYFIINDDEGYKKKYKNLLNKLLGKED